MPHFAARSLRVHILLCRLMRDAEGDFDGGEVVAKCDHLDEDQLGGDAGMKESASTEKKGPLIDDIAVVGRNVRTAIVEYLQKGASFDRKYIGVGEVWVWMNFGITRTSFPRVKKHIPLSLHE